MKRLRALMLRAAGLFGGARRERELTDELDSHLQMNIDDNLRAGMTQKEARHHAMLRLDGVEKTKQAYRERGTLPLVENVVGDLRFAVRQLVKTSRFYCAQRSLCWLSASARAWRSSDLWMRLCWSRFRMQIPAG